MNPKARKELEELVAMQDLEAELEHTTEKVITYRDNADLSSKRLLVPEIS